MKYLKLLILFAALADTSKEDLKRRQIPNKGIAIPVFMAFAEHLAKGSPKIPNMAAGSLLVSVIFLLVSLYTKGGVGGGDIKLMWAWGMLLGTEKILAASFLGLVMASVVSTGLIASGKKDVRSEIPLGPFLCAGIFLTIVF